MMAAYLMRPVKEVHHEDGRIMSAYTRFLRASLRFWPVTVIAGFVFFIGSIYATSLLPSGFIPDGDESRIVVSAELPPGTKLDETVKTTDAIYRMLKDVPEVKTVYAGGTVGESVDVAARPLSSAWFQRLNGRARKSRLKLTSWRVWVPFPTRACGPSTAATNGNSPTIYWPRMELLAPSSRRSRRLVRCAPA